MKRNRMFNTDEEATLRVREYLFNEYRTLFAMKYENLLNESNDRINGYAYGFLMRKGAARWFDDELIAHVENLNLVAFCKFIELDVSTIESIVSALMRKTDKWASFQLVNSHNPSHYNLWSGNDYFSLRYKLVLLTHNDVAKKTERQRKIKAKKIGLLHGIMAQAKFDSVLDAMRVALWHIIDD
jgi:hypothetical protein